MTETHDSITVEDVIAYVRRRAQANRDDSHRLKHAPEPIDPDYPLDAEYHRMVAVELDEITLAIEQGRIT